jgi:hypothetical protein
MQMKNTMKFGAALCLLCLLFVPSCGFTKASVAEFHPFAVTDSIQNGQPCLRIRGMLMDGNYGLGKVMAKKNNDKILVAIQTLGLKSSTVGGFDVEVLLPQEVRTVCFGDWTTPIWQRSSGSLFPLKERRSSWWRFRKQSPAWDKLMEGGIVFDWEKWDKGSFDEPPLRIEYSRPMQVHMPSVYR